LAKTKKSKGIFGGLFRQKTGVMSAWGFSSKTKKSQVTGVPLVEIV
jgi:hypothetical protein